MIETRTRDPQQTVRDIGHLLDQLREKDLVPFAWHIGFFQARDLRDVHERGWRQRAQWTACIQLAGSPCFVSQLEDRVTVFCKNRDGSMATYLCVDRRASGA